MSKFLTFLVCSRKRNNPDSELLELLNSMKHGIIDQEKSRIEVLIKFDRDDLDTVLKILNLNYQKGIVEQPNLLKSLPFTVKYFTYNRGEGRRSQQNDFMFLFAQRDPDSKFVCFTSDDSIMTRKLLFNELNIIKNPDYAIIGEKKPRNYSEYKKNQNWRNDVAMFPIVSTKILEICCNMGWQPNLDNWFTLLHIILLNKYGLNLWHTIPKFMGRIGGHSKESQYNEPYNNMELSMTRECENPYYFNLVEQQAKNIYLNWQENEFKKFAQIIQRSFK